VIFLAAELGACSRRFAVTRSSLASLWRSPRPIFALLACVPKVGLTLQGDPRQQIVRARHPERDATCQKRPHTTN
jgi:hypothetical protein